MNYKDEFKHIRNIIFDFDGVIVDSMSIRTEGFREIFSEYNEQLIQKLIKYHNANGGRSRFNKIQYFYNKLLNRDISENKIQEYAEAFSKIMKDKLTSKQILISDTVNFIEENYLKYNFHIASGSEEKELQYLCNNLEICDYFKTINGSPKQKDELIKNIINQNNYYLNETILIGDSINDYEAAEINNIGFWGYNNIELKGKGIGYIDKF